MPPPTCATHWTARCTRFKASVGVDDEVGPPARSTFEVYADARPRSTTPACMTGPTATKVDRRLDRRRDASCASSSPMAAQRRADHGDWALARIECASATTDTVSPTITARRRLLRGQRPASRVDVSPTRRPSPESRPGSRDAGARSFTRSSRRQPPVRGTVATTRGSQVSDARSATNYLAGNHAARGDVRADQRGSKRPRHGELARPQRKRALERRRPPASARGHRPTSHDMTWTQATNGWGPVEKDRSNGEPPPVTGHRSP